MSDDCLACGLTAGDSVLGGRVHETQHWVVEHCVGPLGVGTLLVKPFRHCVHVSDLTEEESAELGHVLRQTAACVQELTEAEQVYVCLWSHMGAVPVHIHFVVQPSWAHCQERYSGLGPLMQVEQFEQNELPAPAEVTAFCDRARAWQGWSGAAQQGENEGSTSPRAEDTAHHAPVLEGSCACNKVQYEIRGELLGPVTYCHCWRCRKHSGSSFGTTVGVKTSDLSIVRGDELLSSWESSPGVQRFFASCCGSPLYKRNDAMPELVGFRLGTLDTDPGRKGELHFMVDSTAPWVELEDSLPRKAGGGAPFGQRD